MFFRVVVILFVKVLFVVFLQLSSKKLVQVSLMLRVSVFVMQMDSFGLT